MLKEGFWALMSPVIILGGIYGGICSPTEAATISIFYSLIVSLFIYRTIKIRDLPKIMLEGIHSYAPILIILSAAVAFARVITLMNVATIVSEAVLSAISSKVVILLLINVLLLFVGMIMDTGPAILVFTPVLLPVAEAIGVDPIHFGIIMCVNLAIGFVTPPMGANLFVASNLSKVSVFDIARKAVPFILAFLIALLLITFSARDQHVLAAVRAPGQLPVHSLIIFNGGYSHEKVIGSAFIPGNGIVSGRLRRRRDCTAGVWRGCRRGNLQLLCRHQHCGGFRQPFAGSQV